jgi:16S rRNA (uracil1498-N3)-methyltransferase
MKQFILGSEPGRNGQILFEGSDYHYLVRVRRLAPGEYFPALLPSGTEVLMRVCSVGNNVLVGEVSHPVLDNRLTEGAALPPIFLFQALPKGEKMNLIVRQAAEGGLTEIVPFVSEFSVSKISEGGGQKYSRWERIIKEARQQSGSAVATIIQRPMSIDMLFTYWEHIKTQKPGIIGLLFHHLPLANGRLHRYLDTSPEMIVLAVGPEGGFSPAEVERFLVAGFKPFTFAGTVLRTETAALYAAAAIRVLLLERDTWETK